jgi:hypothetical protein
VPIINRIASKLSKQAIGIVLTEDLPLSAEQGRDCEDPNSI